MKMDEMLNKALEDKVESDKVDFKEIFSISSKADWCELIKDIVAMANSGGGILLIFSFR
jgi:predicted HTH transcriptional regulator